MARTYHLGSSYLESWKFANLEFDYIKQLEKEWSDVKIKNDSFLNCLQEEFKEDFDEQKYFKTVVLMQNIHIPNDFHMDNIIEERLNDCI